MRQRGRSGRTVDIASRCFIMSGRAVKHRPDTDRSFAIKLMEHLVVPTFVIDVDSRVLVWNKACERLTGVSAESVLHTSDHWSAFYPEPRPCLADLLAKGDFASIGALYADWNEYGMSDFGVSVQNWCVMPQLGRRLYLAIDAGPIYDDSGSLIAVVETVRDITAQHEQQRILATLAAKDALTGLANRRTFDDTLMAEVRRASRAGSPLSLLMLDVDCFKSFNDTYGHQRGDTCLKAVAEAIQGAVRRAGDTVARYGGEEFSVILPDTDQSGAAITAERIRRAVVDLGLAHGGSTAAAVVTVSLGAATAVLDSLDAGELVKTADAALYRAKRAGRNRIILSEVASAFMFV